VHLGLAPIWGFEGLHKICIRSKQVTVSKLLIAWKSVQAEMVLFWGLKTLLWKIINNVISNTNQKGVSRDREDETKITLVQLYATYIRRIDFDIFVKLAIKIFGNFLLIHMVKTRKKIDIETNYVNIGLPSLCATTHKLYGIIYTGQFRPRFFIEIP